MVQLLEMEWKCNGNNDKGSYEVHIQVCRNWLHLETYNDLLAPLARP